jgi:hypothetical protein
MNKLEKILREKGEEIGRGGSRIAIKYHNRIFKIPREDELEWATAQTKIEEQLYNLIPKEYKKFFPNPIFMGRVVAVDEVYIAEDFFCYDEADKYLSSFHNFVEEEASYQDKKDIFALLDILEDLGCLLVDILDNDTNYGITEDGMIKITDWGISDENDYF